MMLSQLVVQVGWEERTGGGAIGTDDDSDDECACAATDLLGRTD